jgi:hypothetical protein
MRYFLEVNEHVRPEALQALLEREIGPETKDTIVTAGQELIEQGRQQGISRASSEGSPARWSTSTRPASAQWREHAGSRPHPRDVDGRRTC